MLQTKSHLQEALIRVRSRNLRSNSEILHIHLYFLTAAWLGNEGTPKLSRSENTGGHMHWQ